MNKFFGIGKVLVDINYEFSTKPNLFAVANTLIEFQQHYISEEKFVIRIEGINNIADKMYRQLFKGCNIIIMGFLLTNGAIQVLNFKVLK